MIQIHSRSISDPPLSDMDFKNQIEKVSTILKDIFFKIEIWNSFFSILDRL